MTNFSIIKNSIRRLRYFFSDYFLTSLAFQIIRVILVLPLLSFVFSQILANSRLSTITNNNILVVLKHPLNLGLGLVLILIAIVFIFYQLGFYFALANRQVHNKTYSFISISKRLNKKAKYFFSFYAIFFAIYFLVLSPIVMTGLNTGLTRSIKIPDFIIDELLLSTPGLVLYIVLLLALSYLSLRLIYTIYFFIGDENLNIKAAMKKSISFSKNKSLQNFILIGLASLGFSAFMALAIFICLLPVIITDYLIPSLSPLVAGLSLSAIYLLIFFLGGFFEPLIINIIVETTDPTGPQMDYRQKPLKLFAFIGQRKFLSALSGLALILILVLNISSLVNIIYRPQTLVIGHRGFTKRAVENSLEGLRAAKEAGADYVELDIQETVDGKFVVIHDFNLKRLAGLNKSVKDMTYDELTSTNLSQNGYTAKIPGFEEFLDLSKEIDMKLLIEIKPHGNESIEMEENYLAILKEKNLSHKYLTQSLDLKTLERLKSLDPNLKTGYIVPFLVGPVPATVNDFLVLEDFSVKKSTLEQVRSLDQQLFVWTINEEKLMKKYFKMGVSAMITNRPDLAIKIRDQDEANKSFFDRLIYILEK